MNSSDLLPSPPPPPPLTLGMPQHIFFIVMHLSLTMTLAVMGNVLLVFVIVRGNRVARRRLSPVQLLLLHTCTADFLFAFFSLGTEIRLLIAHPLFPGPDSLCRAVHYLQMVPLYASPFLLVAISADRYQAICRPLDNFRQSRYRRPNCLAAVAWTLALILSIPQLFVWQMITFKGEKTGRTYHVCRTTYGQEQTGFKTFYILLFNGLAWLLPSFLAGFFYYNVCKAVWMSHRPEKIVKCEEKNNMATQKYIDKLREASCGHKRQNSEFDRKRTQTVRLTMTIIACNFFLWAPFCITNIIQAISPEMISKEAIIFFVIFGNLNSCVNPWIYILFNRKHVARAFCGRPSKGCATRSETDCQQSRLLNGVNNCKESNSSTYAVLAHHERASDGGPAPAAYARLVGEPDASAKTSVSTDKGHVRFSEDGSSPTSSIGTEVATSGSPSTTTLTTAVRASDGLPQRSSDYGIDDTVTTAFIDLPTSTDSTLGTFIAGLTRKGYCNGTRSSLDRVPVRSPSFTTNGIYV